MKPSKPALLRFSGGLFVLAVIFVSLYVLYGRYLQKKTGGGESVQGVGTGKATLEVLSDDVFVKHAGQNEYILALEDQEVSAGTMVKTDALGRAQIVYPNATVTRIDVNTEIAVKEYIEAPFGVSVQIISGRVWSRVAKLLGKEEYKTESFNLVATVRGTSYGHEVLAAGQDKLVVTKSSVLGTCTGNSIYHTVTENKHGLFNCGKNSPPVVKELTQHEKADEWLMDNKEADELLHERFGFEMYDDDPTHSPSPTDEDILEATQSAVQSVLGKTDSLLKKTPTPTPTKSVVKAVASPTATPKPTPTPEPTAKPTEAPTKTPEPTPTPPLKISSVELFCSPCSNKSYVGVYVKGGPFYSWSKLSAVAYHTKLDQQVTGRIEGIKEDMLIVYFYESMNGLYSLVVLQDDQKVVVDPAFEVGQRLL